MIDCYSIKPIDGATLAAAARETGHLVVGRGPLARGRARRGGARRARRAGVSAKVTQLAVREMPRSGKPDELLHAFGIDAGDRQGRTRTRARPRAAK